MRIRCAFPFVILAAFISSPAALALLGCSGSGGDGPADGFVVDDPEVAGPYVVDAYRTEYVGPDYGTYQGVIYFPTSPGGIASTAHGSSRSGPLFPAVIVANGYTAPGILMDWLTKHLASHGYVVLALTPPKPFLLDVAQWGQGFTEGAVKLRAENENGSSPVYRAVATDRIGFVGTSIGGAGAFAAAGSGIDVAAVVGLAPAINEMGIFVFRAGVEGSRNIAAPTQILVGDHDCVVFPEEGTFFGPTVVTGEGAKIYYENIPARKQYVEIAGANHFHWMSEWGVPVTDLVLSDLIHMDCEAAIPVAEQHRIGAKYATMWLDKFLYGTDAWEDALFGRGIAADLREGFLSEFMID